MSQQEVRKRLEAQLGQLLAREERIDDHQHNVDREVPKDWEELATFRENDEVVDALEGHTKHQIASIRATLRRMDDGSWGECVSCGDSISEPRLRALPTAPTCLACAERLEH